MKVLRRGYFPFFGLALFLIFIGFIIVYVAYTLPEFNQYRLVRSYPQPKKKNTPATILLWSSFFGDKRWDLPLDSLGPNDFRDTLRCPVYQCELTNNHDFLPSIDMYDAIVFHAAESFPLLNSVPCIRAQNQLYVFATMESPGETKHILSDEQFFYNLTMTYRLDSDILWPYNFMEDIETGAIVSPVKNPKWRKPSEFSNDTILLDVWSNKTNDVAWFVSHCSTLSKREKLAEALQKYINVDIFGKCGPNRCERSLAICDEMLDKKYKFYLSFENTLCTDYVTEKLFNTMQRTIIPVVFGGANYTRFVPPRSYINAEDFSSVEALANYLHYLGSNPKEYMSYFWWRNYYRFTFLSPFCGLCEKLHTSREKTQIYRNIENWWIGGSCRFKSKIEF